LQFAIKSIGAYIATQVARYKIDKTSRQR